MLDVFHGFVRRLVEAFENSGLDYAFTGALAASFYGVPRTTSDVDVMVAVAGVADVKAKVAAALRHVGLEVDERRLNSALTSGYKIASFKSRTAPYTVDVIFSDERLEKRAGTVSGLRTFFQSPEGLVLAKLRMIKATVPPERAAKDKADVQAILAFSRVDLAVVRRQARQDGTLAILESLME
ncbi:MAG: hypothetical protein QXP44_06585 [Candidatus Bathyarchaeia archaeon]